MKERRGRGRRGKLSRILEEAGLVGLTLRPACYPRRTLLRAPPFRIWTSVQALHRHIVL